MNTHSNSNKLDNTHLIEVCQVCLRPIAKIRSHVEGMCINCARIAELSNKLDKVFSVYHRELPATPLFFSRICRIRNIDSTRIANCPVCGARSRVHGYLSPRVSCPICRIIFSQFNGKVVAYDTLTSRDIPYASDNWRPIFERNYEKDAIKKSNILDRLKELNL